MVNLIVEQPGVVILSTTYSQQVPLLGGLPGALCQLQQVYHLTTFLEYFPGVCIYLILFDCEFIRFLACSALPLTGGLWSRLGPSQDGDLRSRGQSKRATSSGAPSAHRHSRRESDEEEEEEDDSRLQKMWGAMIKEKEQQSNRMKKSRLDNLPSLQIEISRDSSNGSDSDS